MGEFEIRLENLRFFCRHGVFPHETRDGNEFEVNLAVKYDAPLNQDDSLENTVSYVDLYEIVKEEMRCPRKLIETVAREIARRAKERFSQISVVECKVTKLSPPVAGFIGSASVTYRI